MANVLTRDMVEEYITDIVNPDEDEAPIPRQRITALHFNDMELTGINNNAFEDLNLPSLIGINLSHNQIELLQPNVFNGLEDIDILNLRNNNITDLPNNLFNNLENLEQLELDGNDIQRIHIETKNYLKNNNINIFGINIDDPYLAIYNDDDYILFNPADFCVILGKNKRKKLTKISTKKPKKKPRKKLTKKLKKNPRKKLTKKPTKKRTKKTSTKKSKRKTKRKKNKVSKKTK